MSTSTPETETSTGPRWVDDGHQVTVTLRYGQFEYAVICPFTADGLAGNPWEALPVCRRAGDEGGNPRPDRSPTKDCAVALYAGEWTSEEFFDGKAPEFEVVSPFPVVYRFDGWDGEQIYVRPKVRAGDAPGRDELRTRIANARAEIRAQSLRHHVAGCGSPVGDLVDEVLAAVETHLVDPEYRPATTGTEAAAR